MQLQPETIYQMRNGENVGPLMWDGYIWRVADDKPVDGRFIGMWLPDGTSDLFFDHHPEYDIVSEWTDTEQS